MDERDNLLDLLHGQDIPVADFYNKSSFLSIYQPFCSV